VGGAGLCGGGQRGEGMLRGRLEVSALPELGFDLFDCAQGRLSLRRPFDYVQGMLRSQ